MAAFRDDPSEHERLDHSLLLSSPVTMYFRRSFLDEDVGWLRSTGYVIDTFDASE